MNPIDWLVWIYGKFFVGHRPAVGYFVVMAVGAILAALFWMAAIDKYRSQHPQKSVPAPSAQSPGVSAADWKSLAKDFQALPGRVRADWHRDVDRMESWELYHPASKSLCALAGAMLIKSPKVSRSLPHEVRSETDAMSRWLSFLKKTHYMKIEHYYRETPEGGEKVCLYGSIQDVRESSSTACMECAAAET